MSVINLFSWVILLGFPLYGLRAGSGMLLYVGVLTGIFGLGISALEPVFVSIIGKDSSTVGLWQALFFILLCATAFPLGAYITRFLPISFDPFDWMIGGIFGGVTSVIMVHFLLVFLLVASRGFPMHSALAKSFLVRQIVYFDEANALSTYLMNLGSEKPIHAPE